MIWKEQITPKTISLSCEILRKGGLVVGPTDTVYGVFGSVSRETVEKIMKLKGRPYQKPLGLFVKDLDMLRKIADTRKREEIILALSCLQTTFVLPKKVDLPVGVGTDKTIGIRMGCNRFIKEVLQIYKSPVLQTSFNISGQKVCQNKEEMLELLKQTEVLPDLIVYTGELPALPSTVIDLTQEPFSILRQGAQIDKIREILKGFLGPKLS